MQSLSSHSLGRTALLAAASAGRVEVDRVRHDAVLDIVRCNVQAEF